MQLLTSFQSRPLASPEDFPALVDFYQQCEEVDQLGHVLTLENLQKSFDTPRPNWQQFRQLWLTPQGQLVGAVGLWLRTPCPIQEARFSVRVLPAYRGQGLESALFAWAEACIQEQTAQANLPVQVQINTRDDLTYYRDLYTAHGYQPIRWFHDMERPLTKPVPRPQFPAGFTSRPTTPEEAEAWVEMFNETFVDHWNHHPMTLEDRRFRLGHPSYQSALDWVAIAPDGTLAAFCYGNINAEENARKNRQDGWIFSLGTRRGYRRLGLARAMLLQGIRQLQEAGVDIAWLGVDAQNPNQAKALYDSVGFQVKETHIAYEKQL
jgi:mycothiol synthase